MKKYQVAILVALVNGGVHVAFAEEAKSAAAPQFEPIPIGTNVPLGREPRRATASRQMMSQDMAPLRLPHALNPEFVPIRSSECDQNYSRRQARSDFESFDRSVRQSEQMLVLLQDAYQRSRGTDSLSMGFLRRGVLGNQSSAATLDVLNTFYDEVLKDENSLCSALPEGAPMLSNCSKLRPLVQKIRARAQCYASAPSNNAPDRRLTEDPTTGLSPAQEGEAPTPNGGTATRAQAP